MYTAFLDLSFELASLAMDWMGDVAGLSRTFIFSAFAALAAMDIAVGLIVRQRRGTDGEVIPATQRAL